LPIELIFLFQQVVNGLLLGCYYLLIALGLSIIFSLGGVVNLAHGAFYAIGAYLIVTLTKHMDYGYAFVVSPILVAVLGMVIERLFLRRFYKADPTLSLLFTFALSMIIEQTLRMIYGASPLAFAVPQFAHGQMVIGEFFYPYYRVSMLGVAVVAVASTWFLLNRTAFGKIVKAGINDPDMVRAMGISLSPIMTAVAGLGIGLAGLAGVLLAPITGVQPAMGQEILTAAFVVEVFGALSWPQSWWASFAA